MRECWSCTSRGCWLRRNLTGLLLAGSVISAAAATPAWAQGNPPPPIADNSFLLEEAYNQEKGVIQHISAFQRSWGSSSWAYLFVEEWPAGGQKSQLSISVPIERTAGPSAVTGIGDVLLNYRWQAAGTEGNLSVAPRASLILPTGSVDNGFGAGTVGLQVNLPVSVTHGPKLVTHWNAGATLIPSARNVASSRATTTDLSLGASAILRVHPNVHLMLETAWSSTQVVIGPGLTATGRSWVVNPGIRWAHNFENGLQIVPGVSFPIGIGPSSGDNGLFLYVSFEHPL